MCALGVWLAVMRLRVGCVGLDSLAGMRVADLDRNPPDCDHDYSEHRMSCLLIAMVSNSSP